jgi:hypothetical protein
MTVKKKKHQMDGEKSVADSENGRNFTAEDGSMTGRCDPLMG